jgi:hypothetical protein
MDIIFNVGICFPYLYEQQKLKKIVKFFLDGWSDNTILENLLDVSSSTHLFNGLEVTLES